MANKDKHPRGKGVDWDSIEKEYRAGQLSVREIASINGVSHTAIQKRAKKYEWTQNLAPQIRQEIEAKLATDQVASSVAAGNTKEIIQAAALRGIEIVRQHRVSIKTGQKLVTTLFEQLEEATTLREQIEHQIDSETAGDDDTKRRNAMLKAVSLPAHISALKDLSAALKNFVMLDRQAFGIDGRGPEQGNSGVLRMPTAMTEDEWVQQ